MGQVEVRARIDASPDRVWELIGDPTRMGEWSPECERVEWAGGATGPGLKARFKGHNRLGWRRWATSCTIVRYDPWREVAWNVDIAMFPVAEWSYRIEAGQEGGGCEVVESFRDRRGRAFHLLGPAARGVKDVDAHNRAGMEETLARIKAAAEGTRPGDEPDQR
jgi:uncharacterized protein YndB with AHSA1/START domain